MCYNSTSPLLFLQIYYSLIIGYIQKRVPISSKRSTFFVIVLSVMSASIKPKETTIEVVLRLLDLLISW